MMVLSFHSDLHRDTPIDLFVTEPFDFSVEFRAAKAEEIAPGVPMRILRLETLLRMKEQAGRPQDLVDLAQLRRLHHGGPHA